MRFRYSAAALGLAASVHGLGSTCVPSDNNCLADGLHGGCTNLTKGEPRVGLANPFCRLTEGAPPTVSKSACELETELSHVWDRIDAAINVSQPETGTRNLIGALVRLSFHDALEFDQSSVDGFGTDGCLSAASIDHDLLWEAKEEIASIIEPEWQANCDKITRADFWVLMATLGMRARDQTGTLSKFLKFQSGRMDNCNCDATPPSRFPVAQEGESVEDVLTRVFVDQLGLEREEGTTLLGAHTVGSMTNLHLGAPAKANGTPWTTKPESFDNLYFFQMVKFSWIPSRGNKKGVWRDFGKRNDNRAMLNIDLVGAFHFEFDESTNFPVRRGEGSTAPVGWCGKLSPSTNNGARFGFCEESRVTGRADMVFNYTKADGGNEYFLEEFAEAWMLMMTQSVASGELSDIEDSCAPVESTPKFPTGIPE